MAGILSDSDLASFRTLVEDLAMPDVCDVIRLTETQGSGGTTTTPTTIASGVACRYSEQPNQADELIAERQGIAIDAVLMVPALQDITAADRVRVTVGGEDFGEFEVSDVQRRSWEITRRVYLRQT